MASHVYKTSGGDEQYVILGNDVLLKCNIPSFVADFVAVTGWLDSEGTEYLIQSKYGNLVVIPVITVYQESTSLTKSKICFLSKFICLV